ncbi:MAG: bifunctional oligoribonuclease/PAP phosphatase NrnA [Spirochaetaceae bacterium]|jgi:phosphoesterase RecJ-like protein|nr:bifunctional oligoribonuclease/PAP phosphatase NrnA [Spirochaetaceae bacterium]
MNLLTAAQAESFKRFLDAHGAFVIAAHKEPDGDGLASCLGVAALVSNLGKRSYLFSAGPFKRPEIKCWEKFFPKKLPPAAGDEDNPGLIIVDCSEKERLGEINLDLTTIDTFILDHHRTSAQGQAQAIIDPAAPSTTVVVQQLYEHLIGPVDGDTARTLFFGLATDTGFFRFISPGEGEALRAAARLVDGGADPRRIYDAMNGGKPFLTRKLLGLMLDRAEQKFNGRVIYTYETAQDTAKLGQFGRDSDALYQLLLSVDKVEAVLVVREETDKKCTAALRSRGDIDVSAIAAKFGGGGHKNAAGLSTEGSVQFLLKGILGEFAKIFKPAGAESC